MSSHVHLGPRHSTTESIRNSAYRTPALSPPEELKLLRLWERLLDFFDQESPSRPTDQLQRTTTPSSIDSAGSLNPSSPQYPSSDGSSSIVSRFRIDRGLDKRQTSSSKLNVNSPYLLGKSGKSSSSLSAEFQGPSADDWPRKQKTAREALWSMLKDDHPDDLLVKYLVDSKWDVDAAFAGLLATSKWRVEVRHVDEIVYNGEHGAYQTLKTSKNKRELKIAEGFLHLVKVGTSYCRGVDWQGRPVFIQRACVMHSNTQPLESVRRFIVWHREILRLVIPPSAVSVITIYDMTEAGPKNLDVGAARFLIDTVQKYYPQAIAETIIHRAPKIFEGFWNIVKKALTPESASRIHFTRTVTDLEEFVQRKHIPWWMGGDDDFEYSYPEPVPNENWQMSNVEARGKLMEEHAKASISFEDATRDLITATRHGDPDIEDIKSRRAVCVQEVRKIFWMVDPMVRSRTIYDRWGLIDLRRNAALQGDMFAPGTDKLLSKLYTEAGIDLNPKRYGQPNFFWQSQDHLESF